MRSTGESYEELQKCVGRTVKAVSMIMEEKFLLRKKTFIIFEFTDNTRLTLKVTI